MKIIILSLTKYKEKDSIINAISEDGYITFTAHGILSPTSKNASINNVLTVADVVLSEGKTGKLNLKESSVILSPVLASLDINYLCALNSMAEATNKMLPDEEKHLAFPYLLKAIEELKTNRAALYVLIAYLAKLLKLTGYSLEINRCVRCGTKVDIIGFSLFEGGFICKKCISEDDVIDFTGEEMLLVRILCGTNDFDFRNNQYDEELAKHILHKFIKFIEDGAGVYINSPKLIINY